MEAEVILTSDEWIQIRDFIYQKTGLYFSDDKKEYLQRRVKIAMSQCNSKTVDEYMKILDTDKGVFKSLLELITTNETYFFRDIPQLEIFANNVLPEILTKKANNKDFKLRIWSAGCSTGEEPYTIAIILKEQLEYFGDWNIEIIGTDISERVLKFAVDARYYQRSLKDVPEYIKLKYFYYDVDSKMYVLSEEIKGMVKFYYMNLYDDIKMKTMKYFDIIFCRNVLIYFDDESRKKVVMNFYDSLQPGGYIFLGHSESVLRITRAFEIVYFDKGLAFRKPMSER